MRKTICIAGVALCSAAVQAHATSTSGCGPFELAIPRNAQVSAATGQNPVVVAVTNRGTNPCSLKGYAALTLLGARGTPLPFAVSHRGDQMITSAAPARVRVRPGRSAYFLLNKYRCDLGTIGRATKIRVRLPGGRRQFTLALPRYPILGHCRGKAANSVSVSPIEPTLAATHPRR